MIDELVGELESGHAGLAQNRYPHSVLNSPGSLLTAVLCAAVGLRFFYLFIPLVMWSLGVTALLVSSVLMTALVAYLDFFDMPSLEEQTATQEILQHLTAQQQQGGPDDPDTRLSLQRTAATTMSGVLSPPRELEQQASSHPPSGPGSQRLIALAQQGRKESAAQVSMAVARTGGCTQHSAKCAMVLPVVAAGGRTGAVVGGRAQPGGAASMCRVVVCYADQQPSRSSQLLWHTL